MYSNMYGAIIYHVKKEESTILYLYQKSLKKENIVRKAREKSTCDLAYRSKRHIQKRTIFNRPFFIFMALLIHL